MKNIKHKKILPYAAGTIGGIIFGTTFACSSEVLKVLSPIELPAVRFFFASIFITILYLLKVFKLDYKGKNIKLLFLVALCEPLLYFIFESMGIKMTNSTISGTMIALEPVVICILAGIFLQEKPNLMQSFMVLICVVGAIIVVFGSYSLPQKGFSIVGFVFLLFTIISGGGYSVSSRAASKSFSPIEITFFMMWFACIAFGILSIFVNKNIDCYITAFTNGKIFVLTSYLGIVCSVGGFFLFNYMFKTASIVAAAVFHNLITVVSVVAGVFIKHDPFNLIQLIGAIIILVGVFGVSYFENDETIEKQQSEISTESV